MELYGKALIYVVFILIILHVVQYLLHKPKNTLSPIESFQNITQTNISNISPSEGDSSTIVKLEGNGFDFISKIYLEHQNIYAQCIILSNRKDNKVEFIPPPITELGKTLKDIRDNIINNSQGIKTNLVFIRGDAKTNEDYALNTADKNVIKVPRLHFYYIDIIPYKNNCIKPGVAPAPTEVTKPIELNIGNTDFEYGENSDLEFLNKILPEKQEKIQKLYEAIDKNLDKYDRLGNRNIKQLKEFQALESVKDMQKQLNIQRYNIHEYLNKHYRNN